MRRPTVHRLTTTTTSRLRARTLRRMVAVASAAAIVAAGLLSAGPAAADTQLDPPWGLGRVDQRDLPLDGRYTYDTTGDFVSVYVIDTGIRITHAEFRDQARNGVDTVGDGRNGADCNGRGTHVAGTVGGQTYGVAKRVRLVNVRVLDCQGTGSSAEVIAGIDWVANNHQRPAVAVLSVAAPEAPDLEAAVRAAVAEGVTFVVGAGNADADACDFSPSRLPEVITVGSTTITDTRASDSNHGPCLDLFAPGENITSAWNSSDTATNTIRGTSMAAAHVAGAAALYLQGQPTASPAMVRDGLVNQATTGRVIDPGAGSPNELLYTLTGPDTPPPPGRPSAPVDVSATPGDARATVSFSPPVSDGGSPITGYTATCGSRTASGASSPITVTNLTNGSAVTCTVHATNAVGDGPESAGVSVTPTAPPPPPPSCRVRITVRIFGQPVTICL